MQDPQNGQERGRGNRRYLILLIVNTLLCFILYRALLVYADMTDSTFASFLVMVLYMALLLGFGLAYLIYNRFFYRKGITAEQLPEEWSAERKCAFIADGERRLRRSRWMILVLFPLIFTFMIDTFDLFIVDLIWRR